MKKYILSLLLLVSLVNADFIRDDKKEVVIDSSTDFMWQDDNRTIGDNKKKWVDAINFCETLNFASYNDWHLPNINELFMLARSIKSNTFRYMTSNYWSSTTFENKIGQAWYIYFYNSTDIAKLKTESTNVRCVRSAD
jgi:hypothetical protein